MHRVGGTNCELIFRRSSGHAAVSDVDSVGESFARAGYLRTMARARGGANS